LRPDWLVYSALRNLHYRFFFAFGYTLCGFAATKKCMLTTIKMLLSFHYLAFVQNSTKLVVKKRLPEESIPLFGNDNLLVQQQFVKNFYLAFLLIVVK